MYQWSSIYQGKNVSISRIEFLVSPQNVIESPDQLDHEVDLIKQFLGETKNWIFGSQYLCMTFAQSISNYYVFLLITISWS